MRVDDAAHATRAAAEEGVVSGGGVALIRARKALDKIKVSGDEAKGISIVRDALSSPLRRIAQNAGANPDEILAKVEKTTADQGFNVLTGKIEPLISSGIVDPAKVTRTALQNAASVATMILTTEALISDIPEKDKSESPAPGGMDF